MNDEFRNKLDVNGELMHKDVHTLLMCVTKEGLKQFMDGSSNEIDMNYVVRPFNVYNPFTNDMESKNLIKVEIFFLSYYYLVKKQSFLEIKREDV